MLAVKSYWSISNFYCKINNTSAAKRSYDTRLIIALNDAGYNNLENLIVNGTSIPKSAFQHGTPEPYNLGWTWPPGDVYPTWFNDTLVNIGTIERKGFKDAVVSVTFSNATDVKMHFDAYGCKDYLPTKKGIWNFLGFHSFVSTGPPTPQPPYVHFFYDPSYPNSNEMVTFNASASYDLDGNITMFKWNFGDGNITTTSDPIITHAYSEFGNYTVTLNVIDSEGKWDTESKIITVVPRRYLVTFNQTGLDATADSTILPVNGSAKTFADLPFIIWVDEKTQISYAYESIVASTISGKRFVLIDVTGPASPITITEFVTVVGKL